MKCQPRKWLLLAGLCLVMVVALWRWKASREQDSFWERIQARGELRVCMDASFPPFESVSESGEFSGLDVALAQELGRRWGLSVRFINISFDGLYDALLDDKCDLIISALPYNRDLTQDVAYSASYLNVGQVMVTRQGTNLLGEKGTLKGKRVAVELGSEGHFVALELNRQKGEPEVISSYTAEEALQLLRSGQTEALILDWVSARISARRYDDLQIHPTPLSNEPYVIAMPRSSPRLWRQVNQSLEALRREGVLDRLVEEWIR